MKSILILFAACVLTSCAGELQSMVWPVQCGVTRLQDLDNRLTDRMYDMHISKECSNGAYDAFTECPAYHTEWRRYWTARHALDQCAVEGVRL